MNFLPVAKMRNNYFALGFVRHWELADLGLDGKIPVDWLDSALNVFPDMRESFVPGYYSSGRDGHRLVQLEEAYPSCLLVAKGVIKKTYDKRTFEIRGLPNGGISEIDFSHYCLGPAFTSYLRTDDEIPWNIELQPISFFREKKSS